MKNVVLKNQNNEVVRVFHCYADKLYLLYKKRTGRWDMCSYISFKEDDKKIKVLKEIDIHQLKNTKLSLWSGYYLEWVDEISEIPVVPTVPSTHKKDFWLSFVSVSVFFIIITANALLIYNKGDLIEDVKKPKPIVQIIKPPTLITPEKVVVGTEQTYTIPKKPVKKVLKRMGALVALGQLSKDRSSQKGGVNLVAGAVSDGPGLRALSATSGSGGVQAAIYGKDMITQALRAGGNIKGGGGYSTKGLTPGGGKAGYGKLTLVGSGGSENLSESSTMSLQGGGFDFSLIERHILQKSGELHNCYDQALKFNSDLKGTFISQFFINQTGQVVSSRVHTTSEVKSKRISSCILNVINQIKFDISLEQKGLLNVIFPFDLSALGT